MSPRPAHQQTSGTEAGMQRHVDEQYSERDYYNGSTYSPNVAESPAVQCGGTGGAGGGGDQTSCRSSYSEGAIPMGTAAAVARAASARDGGVPSGGSSSGDPLARWFEEHYRLLLAAGVLTLVTMVAMGFKALGGRRFGAKMGGAAVSSSKAFCGR